jgi:hypothetical protein
MTTAQFLTLAGMIYLSHETSPVIRTTIGLIFLGGAAFAGLTQ